MHPAAKSAEGQTSFASGYSQPADQATVQSHLTAASASQTLSHAMVQHSPKHSSSVTDDRAQCHEAAVCSQGTAVLDSQHRFDCLAEPGCSPTRLWQLRDDGSMQHYSNALDCVLRQAAGEHESVFESSRNNGDVDMGEEHSSGLVCIACGAGLQLVLAAAAHEKVDQVVCLQVRNCHLRLRCDM